jgi:hypothetical protein
MWKDEGITSTKGGGLMSMGMHACGRYTWAWCQSGWHGDRSWGAYEHGRGHEHEHRHGEGGYQERLRG